MSITSRSHRVRVPLIVAFALLALALIAPQAMARYVYTGNYDDDTMSLIDTATNQVVGSPIPTGNGPDSIAISPDGKTLYVTSGDGDITVVNTQTNQVVTTISGLPPLETIAISPDGKTAYVSSPNEDVVVVIDLQTNQVVGSPIKVGEAPIGVAFSPDGKVVYVVNDDDDNVSVIDTATRQVVGSPIPVGDDPYELAVTPDGKSVYVANYGTVDSVTAINTQTGGTTTIPVPGGPWQVAIVPDQSPIPAFAAPASKKQPLKRVFNAAGSVDPDGTIVQFNWNFGDGLSALNGGPSLSHTYKKAGTYAASLTLVDNEGCSGFVFTGRTAYCNGPGPLVKPLKVKAPNNFKFGKLSRNTKNGTAKLKIKLPSPGKLTVSGKKVKQVKRGTKQATTVTVNIRPKPKVKKQLASTGSAKVQLKVKFKPTGGKAKTKGRSVKLIQG